MKKIVLATTDSKISARELKHAKLARQIADEGIVLLKNDGMLPLKGKKIALYGSGARQTIAGGTGSGATHPRHLVGIEEGFLNAGYNVVSKNWLNKYDEYYDKSYKTWKDRIEKKVEGMFDLYQILGEVFKDKFIYPTGIPVTDDDISKETDNAIYVIARQAGEGTDRKLIKADYLLDDTEYANLKKVCSEYKNVCLVVNVGGFIDLSVLDEFKNISAVVYYSQAGQEGGNALVDILTGKVSPSGKLTATWAKNLSDFPSTSEYSHLGDPKVQNYKEGIYVGYRYFDTFGVKPRYAFGYGLSYTNFEMSAAVQLIGDNVLVKCNVENVGNFAGKEVVQIYASLPGENVEAKRLIAFCKTDIIGIGGKQQITLSFGLRDLCRYDESKAAYVLLDGDYVIRIGNSSDNVKPIAVFKCDENIIVEQCVNVCKKVDDFEELIALQSEKEDLTNIPYYNIDKKMVNVRNNTYGELPVSTDKKIAELLNKFSNEELASLVVGSGTDSREEERLLNVMGASGSTTSRLYEKYGIPNVILSDGPAGLNITPRVVELPDGQLKSADPYPQYDFGMFGKIMHTRMLAKPEDGICHYQYATTFPAGVVRAQTWNTRLMEEFGDAMGTEMEEFGVTVWLAPGINITRNTLCGRTFEYCSEDPVLSGEIAAATVIGVQKHKGKGVSLKHFACNNSENERQYSSSNVSERALREIYLKGFEIVVKKANPITLMASYNKINGVYSTNNYDLLVKVLRNEWGYQNTVISDWDSVLEGRGDILIANKAQCDLVMPGGKKQVRQLTEGLNSGDVDRKDVIRSSERILKIIENNTIIPFKN